MRILSPCWFTLSFVMVTGCGDGGPGGQGAGDGAADHRAFTTADPWYTGGGMDPGATPLDQDRFGPVRSELQPEAQAELADVPFKGISPADAARFLGRPMPAGETDVYVLLRAVALNEGTGRFTIGLKKGSVLVHHGSLGRGPVPMTRKALVAVLPALPERVLVSCSMAQ